LPSCSFVLHAFAKKAAPQKLYRFKVMPWVTAVENVRKAFEIRAHKIDKNVFTLYFKHADRHLASQFLNLAMLCYQDYYRKENDEICATHLAYLEKRQDELIRQFDSALKEHVVYLKRNISESGCIGFSDELDLLSSPQNAFTTKLFDVDLELKRLEQRLPSKNEERDANDCDALTLQSAKALYLQYTEKKDASEAQLRERIYLRDRLNDPDFELSSLTTFLTDTVSVSLAQHASDIALKIKDGENRTAREQERLKEELDTQKRFLHQHLTHMIELEKLQLKLLAHKIDSLQLQTLHLLDAEKLLIQEKIGELNHKMSSLPEKWHRENLLLLKKELGSKIIGSMTQLVETKNLNQKLYQVSSKHLDLSTPPLKAVPPHLVLSSLFTALLGCFIYYIYKLCALLVTGFPVSHVNATMSGYFSCGTLSPRCDGTLERLSEQDLSTLRGAVQFLCALEPHSCIALLDGKNPNYSAHLAALLSLAGKKVLLLHYLFDPKEEKPGLFAYLQGKEKEIPIVRVDTYDEVASGERWRYAADKLVHPQFLHLIEELKQQYDYVLLRSDAAAHSREAYAFARIADALLVAVRDESQEDLVALRATQSRLALICFN
jgi:tyrosine-protein kinase Etk/Wzc